MGRWAGSSVLSEGASHGDRQRLSHEQRCPAQGLGRRPLSSSAFPVLLFYSPELPDVCHPFTLCQTREEEQLKQSQSSSRSPHGEREQPDTPGAGWGGVHWGWEHGRTRGGRQAGRSLAEPQCYPTPAGLMSAQQLRAPAANLWGSNPASPAPAVSEQEEKEREGEGGRGEGRVVRGRERAGGSFQGQGRAWLVPGSLPGPGLAVGAQEVAQGEEGARTVGGGEEEQTPPPRLGSPRGGLRPGPISKAGPRVLWWAAQEPHALLKFRPLLPAHLCCRSVPR